MPILPRSDHDWTAVESILTCQGWNPRLTRFSDSAPVLLVAIGGNYKTRLQVHWRTGTYREAMQHQSEARQVPRRRMQRLAPILKPASNAASTDEQKGRPGNACSHLDGDAAGAAGVAVAVRLAPDVDCQRACVTFKVTLPQRGYPAQRQPGGRKNERTISHCWRLTRCRCRRRHAHRSARAVAGHCGICRTSFML